MMPFRPDLDDIYAQTIKPTVEKLGLQCIRADEEVGPTRIMDDIWRFIRRGRVFIADLTGRNANVFYELGLAHAQGKAVILISQSLDDVPFDLQHVRVLHYANNGSGRLALAANLSKTLATVFSNLEDAQRRDRYSILASPKSTSSVCAKRLESFDMGGDISRYEQFFDMLLSYGSDPRGHVNDTYDALNRHVKNLSLSYDLPHGLHLVDEENRKGLFRIWRGAIEQELQKREGDLLKLLWFGEASMDMRIASFWTGEEDDRSSFQIFVLGKVLGWAREAGISQPLLDRITRRLRRYFEQEYPEKVELVAKYWRRMEKDIRADLQREGGT